MATERDIWTAAQTLVERHGDNAEFHAAKRADELLDDGDMDGRWVWLRILDAVKMLQARRPDDGEAIH